MPVESAQFAARAYRKLAAMFKTNVSMSRRANAWGNAPMESFFKTLKVERIYQTHYDRSMSRCTWKRGSWSIRLHWIGVNSYE
ncbi:hypothetical protein WL80_00330 [Burkholderia ubonensis]|nr:hypothetical protein WL80_00330 [Burkholderia ubonensis]